VNPVVRKIGQSLFISLLSTGILVSEEAGYWIGGYSSGELEITENYDEKKTIYYEWQVESLKRAVSPRYIRLLDIGNYAESGRLLNKGVLFSYNGLKNEYVSVCGNFLNWECKPMKKNRFGIFYTIIPMYEEALNESSKELLKYKYKFFVDGLYVTDPSNDSKETDENNTYSVYYPEEPDIDTYASTKILEDSEDDEFNLRTVRFQIYLPNAETVSIVGDFNNWNNESDYMIRKKGGLFQLDLKLQPGTYYYNFIADGEMVNDLYNPNIKIRLPYGYKVSELTVPERLVPIERKN